MSPLIGCLCSVGYVFLKVVIQILVAFLLFFVRISFRIKSLEDDKKLNWVLNGGIRYAI